MLYRSIIIRLVAYIYTSLTYCLHVPCLFVEDLEFEHFDFRDQGYQGFVAVSSDEYPDLAEPEARSFKPFSIELVYIIHIYDYC